MSYRSHTPDPESRWHHLHEYARLGFGTILAAVAVNVLFYFLGKLVVDYHPDFAPLANPGPTIILTAVASTIAVVIYGLLMWYSGQPARNFIVLSAIVLVLSFLPSLLVAPDEPGSSSGQIAMLVLMHVIAAAIIAGILTRFGKPPPRRT